MTRHYRLEYALLPQGWNRNIGVAVSDAGFVTAIEAAPAPDALRVAGYVVPGMANAHSHAFQRAMAGGAEHRGSARDSFWTWRQAMYALANRIEPEELQVVAAQLFIEMLKSGYTSVAEFHYLHRRCGGAAYLGSNALWEAVRGAAQTAGIGLTLLPTLYQTSDFNAAPLTPDQTRFALTTDEFLRAIETGVAADRRAASPIQRTGAAFHSLRAVPFDQLREAARRLTDIDASMPVHIHVAEQLREVEACERATGRRPIELLLTAALPDEHWCLVHCTHSRPDELRGIAACGAAVCVSISTEANLGDGIFDSVGFLNAGGRLCIGSDSQATVSPAEELRWMEYQQRLRRKRRNVLATKSEPHTGARLWRDAAVHGARALGQPTGAIAVGRRADWLVLDPEHPALTGSGAESVLDHVIFAGADAAIRDCMVAGRWVDHQPPAYRGRGAA